MNRMPNTVVYITLTVRGKASASSSGTIAALADRAAMLEPGSQDPVILLEGDNRY